MRGVAHLDSMLARLAAGEPLQYVLGRWGFRHLDLMVDRRVLIPRPETETVVELALRSSAVPAASDRLRGSRHGERSHRSVARGRTARSTGSAVWMTDASYDALDVARANAAGIGRAAANVRLATGDWFDALPEELCGRLALVVSNPPYVRDDDPELEPIVRDWEPVGALFGGSDGLDAIRHLVAEAPRWLRPGGWLVIEIGSGQGERVDRAARRRWLRRGRDRCRSRRTRSSGGGETNVIPSSEARGDLTEQ